MADVPVTPAYTLADMQDPANPFYLHPNESPSLVLASVPLSESNFHSWQRSMKMSLLTKNKLGFVDGSIQEPDANSTIHPFWRRCNTMVLAWIVRSLTPAIAQSVLWIDNARTLWDELQERFSQADLFRVSDLQEEIFSFRQGDHSVTSYFTSLKILLDEFDVLLPVPSCTCNANCTCHALQQVKTQRNTLQVARFLKGLSDQYSGVRSQIMLMSPLPTLNKVFGLIVQQERQFLAETGEGAKAFLNTTP